MTDGTEYQPRTAARIIEILRAQDQNPRSWQAEAADVIERVTAHEGTRCPGCGRNLPTFCRIGCGMNDCPMPKEVRRLCDLEQEADEKPSRPGQTP